MRGAVYFCRFCNKPVDKDEDYCIECEEYDRAESSWFEEEMEDYVLRDIEVVSKYMKEVGSQ